MGLPVSEDRIRVDVTVDLFLDDGEESFSVPISDKVESRLRVLLDDEIIVAPVEERRVDTTEEPIEHPGELADTTEAVVDETSWSRRAPHQVKPNLPL